MSNFDTKFILELYNDDFFAWHLKYARDYSIKTMDWYIQEYKPTSVIDFGCGIGSYLESAYNNGIKNIRGYDIGWQEAKKYCPQELHKYISEKDCTQPINEKTYDCVITFETIEHIEPSGTDTFIENLVNATAPKGKILFTGAPPEQDGCGHINCRTKEEWESLFVKHKFYVDKDTTAYVRENWQGLNANCPKYILDNLMVLTNEVNYFL